VNFSEIFKRALAKRLYPYTGLRKEVLCDAIGVHGMTLRSWLRGENAPSGPMVAACINFFTRTGDHTFIQELYPDAVTPLVQRKREADKALELVNGLKSLIGAAA
jgi:hypothetical protein